MSSLDSDSSLQSCLSAINSATNTITTSSSSSDVSSALGNVCGSSATSACGESNFRKLLTNFLAACPGEISGSNPNPAVQNIYDNLYTLAPFRESVCSQDDSQSYCLTTIGKQAAGESSFVQTAKNFLSILVQLPFSKRDTSPFSSSGTYVTPNTTTFSAASLPFLFLNPSTPQATLCSSCSESILKPYIEFESSIANAMGVPNSPLLGGQKKLWDAVQSQCGDQFTSGVVANAGAAPSSGNVTVGGALGAATTVKVSAGGMLAAIVGALIAL